jgi:chitin synthase
MSPGNIPHFPKPRNEIYQLRNRGTKGDNGATKDLGGAKRVKGENGKDFMEVEIPTVREDVDQLWAASRTVLRNKPPEQKEHRDASTKQADHDRNSRTNVVIAWFGG